MLEYICLICEYVWKSNNKGEHCPACGGSDVITEDPSVDDWDGHFEGDIVSRGEG